MHPHPDHIMSAETACRILGLTPEQLRAYMLDRGEWPWIRIAFVEQLANDLAKSTRESARD